MWLHRRHRTKEHRGSAESVASVVVASVVSLASVVLVAVLVRSAALVRGDGVARMNAMEEIALRNAVVVAAAVAHQPGQTGS